jgi:hypothetical protein
MTDVTSPVFTNKETVFREYLLPAGLLAEIVIASVPMHNSIKGERPTRARFAYDLFHTLNLAACYAINPENRDLGLLQSALSQFMVTASKGLPATIAKATQASAFSRILSDNQLAALSVALSEHLTAICKAIDYDPGKAQAWREAQTRIATPLTRNGRINRWRTLVRNSEWARCMGIVGLAPAQTGANPFSSRVGIEKAPDLWRETFSQIMRPAYSEPAPSTTAPEGVVAAVTGEAAPAAPAAPATGSSETFRLPIGVTVNSTADGRLCVQGAFDPSNFLTSKQLQEMKKAPSSVTPELRAAVAMRKFEQLCEFPALAETLNTVSQWRVTQDASRPEVQHAFGQWRLVELKKGVADKLKNNFNSEERRIALEMLLAEHRPAAATPDPAA